MPSENHDPRDIPILTEAVASAGAPQAAPVDTKALQSAVVTETMKLADSLLHLAAKDIEAALYERVFDRLRADLPELVDRVIREHIPAGPATAAAESATGDDHG